MEAVEGSKWGNQVGVGETGVGEMAPNRENILYIYAFEWVGSNHFYMVNPHTHPLGLTHGQWYSPCTYGKLAMTV